MTNYANIIIIIIFNFNSTSQDVFSFFSVR